MIPLPIPCGACGGSLAGAPVIACPRCGTTSHTLCAAQRGGCPRCGAPLPGAVAAMGAAAVAVPAPPPQALTCPRCGAAATPAAGPQQCPRCRGRFALHAGALLDGAVRPPPPDARCDLVKVRWADLVTHHSGLLDGVGVAEGVNDPVTGRIPLETSGVAFADVYTLAVWRRLDVMRLILTLLAPLPLTVLLIAGAFASAWWLIPAALFAALDARLLYQVFGARVCRARIAGRYRTITVRFDQPLRRRRRFHAELLRRCGLAAAELP
ncbi:MAG TPA: hypothetical protein VGQ83_42420 [Polyangia bacterium]|jgi:hypothetical protein